METKKIIWTLPAKNDLQKIFEYLAEVSEIVALKVVQNIVMRTRLLEAGFTKIGQEEPLLKSRKKNYRCLIEGNYKIIYSQNNNEIIIHTIFDTRQNPKKLKRI